MPGAGSWQRGEAVLAIRVSQYMRLSRASASSHRLEIEIVPNPGVRGPVHCYMMNLTLDYLLKSIYKVSVQSPDADTRRGNEKGCLTSE